MNEEKELDWDDLEQWKGPVRRPRVKRLLDTNPILSGFLISVTYLMIGGLGYFMGTISCFGWLE